MKQPVIKKATIIQFGEQFGALPWRQQKGQKLEVLMVTSRISKHWLIPKGWPIAGKSQLKSALQEAFEEAGVRGKAEREPWGEYRYIKLMKDMSEVPCRVTVYGLKVQKELTDWPEREQRERRWFGLAEAADAVTETGLAEFLRLLEKTPQRNMAELTSA